MVQSIQKEIQAQLVINATEGAAATTDINGDEVDMSGADIVEFLIVFGVITATAVTSIKAQQDVVTGMAGAADLLGTSITVADDDDNQIFRLEIIKPRERFVRVVVDRGTANAVVAAGIALIAGSKKLPITQHADVGGQESHASPAEGTA